MKKSIILIVIVFALCIFPMKPSAKTLKDLKNELQELENKKANQDSKKQKTQAEIDSINNRIKEISSFYISRIITLILDMVIMAIGVTLLHFNDKIIKIISQVIVIVGNYLLSKFIVFKRK